MILLFLAIARNNKLYVGLNNNMNRNKGRILTVSVLGSIFAYGSMPSLINGSFSEWMVYIITMAFLSSVIYVYWEVL